MALWGVQPLGAEDKKDGKGWRAVGLISRRRTENIQSTGHGKWFRQESQAIGEVKMSAGKEIRLVEPRSGVVTRPLQIYELIAHADKHRRHIRPSDKADWWRPVRGTKALAAGNDKCLPSPVRFAWVAGRGMAPCDLLLSHDRPFGDPLVIRGVVGGQCEVFHLHIATRYYWKVTTRNADGRAVESAVRSFMTHAAPPRWIRAPEISNLRDLGGWPLPRNRRVRQGMLYRSTEMNSHHVIDQAGERLLVDELKIRTDLDLRRAPEEVGAVLDPARVEWVNVPVDPYGSIVQERGREEYRRVFALLAQERRYPMLIHCWGGADRTGTLAFLILGLLGVKRSDLAHDYELTSLSVWGPRSQDSAEFKGLRAALRPFARRANDIQRQVEGYLLSIGITARQIATMRDLLTEPRERKGIKKGR